MERTSRYIRVFPWAVRVIHVIRPLGYIIFDLTPECAVLHVGVAKRTRAGIKELRARCWSIGLRELYHGLAYKEVFMCSKSMAVLKLFAAPHFDLVGTTADGLHVTRVVLREGLE